MGKILGILLLAAAALALLLLFNLGACGRGGSDFFTCAQLEVLFFLLIADGIGIVGTGFFWLIRLIQKKRK